MTARATMEFRGRRKPRRSETFSHWGLVALGCFAPLLFAGCNNPSGSQEPTVVMDGDVDSLFFWPSAMRYARAGDTISIRILGLQLERTCATVGDIRWLWTDSLGSDFYTLRTEVDVPNASCRRGGTFDSTFRVIFHSHAGETLFLRRQTHVRTDSLLYVSGEAYVETFGHRGADPDSATIVRGAYRLVYHDSITNRPRRFVTATLPICETFQSAVFRRAGDSITVRLRRLVASPLPPAQFPPCEGEHADTMEVVPDLYASP